MTANEQGATAASKNNLHDIDSMISHLESWVESYAHDTEGEDPIHAAILRDMREALITAVMATGLGREDVEEVLQEQRGDVAVATVRAKPEPEGGAEAAVEVEAEPAVPPDAAGTLLAVARNIVTDVKDLHLDEDCLRQATDYLVRAAMSLRSMSRREVDSTSAAEKAEILADILDGPKAE